MASDYDFGGPGVTKPHPKKNWVNPNARQVAFPSGQSRRKSGPSREPSGPSPEPSGRSRTRSSRSLVQVFAALMGLAFLLAGVGGFIPGVTENTDQLELYGTESNAELLGLFRVSILHNIVHLLFAVGLLAAVSAAASKLYLIGGGVAYMGVAAYGFLVEKSSDANFLPINDNDNLLHVGLSSAMIVLGLAGAALDRRG